MAKIAVRVALIVLLSMLVCSPQATTALADERVLQETFRICEGPEDPPCYNFYSVAEVPLEELGEYLEGSALSDPNLGLAITVVPYWDVVEVTWYVRVNR